MSYSFGVRNSTEVGYEASGLENVDSSTFYSDLGV